MKIEAGQAAGVAEAAIAGCEAIVGHAVVGPGAVDMAKLRIYGLLIDLT